MQVELPAGLTGPFYVFVLTDSGGGMTGRVYERGGEGNNATHDPVSMLVTLQPPVDLVAGEIVVPVNAIPGMPMEVTYTVSNTGQYL